MALSTHTGKICDYYFIARHYEGDVVKPETIVIKTDCEDKIGMTLIVRKHISRDINIEFEKLDSNSSGLIISRQLK
jgi:hypothetical protein